MVIDDKLIAYLETLSRLTLSAGERERAKADLSGIIGFMAKLSELDAGDTRALPSPFTVPNVFREDAVNPSFPREDILSGSADATDEFFKAPQTTG